MKRKSGTLLAHMLTYKKKKTTPNQTQTECRLDVRIKKLKEILAFSLFTATR